MSLYGKSSWARLELAQDTKEDDLEKFKNFNDWLGISAAAANVRLWDEANEMTVGINPISQARLDVINPINPTNKDAEDIFYALVDRVVGNSVLDVGGDEVDFSPCYGGLESMMLSDTAAAFWFVKRKRIDLEDQESQKEQIAANMYHMPFRLLYSDDKNEVKDMLDKEITSDRKQNVVLVDFETGRIYTDMTDDKSLMYLNDFFKSSFDIELKATTLYFGPNGTPWQYDFFKKILAGNIINTEMDELVGSYLDDVKFAELQERYPLIGLLYKKKKTYCQYSDDSYVVDLQTPSVICDEKLKASVGATDNISCWEILSEIESWNVLASDVSVGIEDGPKSWKVNVNICTSLTQVLKNVELTKNFIDSHSEDSHSYSEYTLAYLNCLSIFEDLYVSLIKRVLEIEADDTTTGMKPVSFLTESEE
jgi:hypothetical protein